MKTNKRQTATLNQDLKTLATQFKKGDTFKVLGWHGTMIRLSRTTDHAKLITQPENVGIPVTVGMVKDSGTYVPRPECRKYDAPHSDASGRSREVVIATVLAGADSGRVVMHLTPAEELEYNDGMAKLAEMYPG